MRILTRTSKLAIWSRRFGSFALPLSVLPVWMHRNQMLNSETFQLLFLLAIILASLAVLTGIVAYFRLWQTGDHGWGKSTFGIFLGLLCLSPIAYGANLAASYPFANDVTTDLQRPLELYANVQTGLRTPLTPDATVTAFPGVLSRNYDLSPVAVFEQVENLVRQRNWDIRVMRKPGFSDGAGSINAMAMTFLGWRDEVAIRLLPVPSGTRLDMRSASLNGAHDLGTNGKRIEQFLADLDAAVLQPVEVHQEADGTEGENSSEDGAAAPH